MTATLPLRRARSFTNFLAAALAIGWLAAGAFAAEPAPRRPNIVVIVADDLGLQLGCYGDKTIQTPQLDRVAAAGVRFTQAHCTTASCSPSRSVILTGLHNHANAQYGLEHQTHHFRSYENTRSLPVLLSQNGYRTCSIGKIHVGPPAAYKFDQQLNARIQGSRNTVRMAENARELFAAADDRPFFLYFCPTDPHRSGPGQFANGPAGKPPYPEVTPVRYDPQRVTLPAWLPDQPEVRQEWAEYCQSISRLDQGVGRLVAMLEETGQLKNTVLFFLSDNGPPFPGAKTTLYESGTHLPLIVADYRPRGAWHGKPATSDALVSWVDLAPTVLDLAGIDAAPLKLHGRSLRPVLQAAGAADQPAGWDEIYHSHTFHEVTMYYPMRSIRRGKYKYILNLAHPLEFPFASDLFESHMWQGVLRRRDEKLGVRTTATFLRRPQHELYDLAADPHETRNLATDPAHSATLADLQAKLKAWQTRTADPWAIKYEHE